MDQRTGGDLLQWLRGFYHLVQCGGVSRAAKHMGLNQSAVSHQIKNLEQEFQVTLFHRGAKELQLTDHGRLLYTKAVAIFDLLRETRQELGAEEGILQGRVSMALTHTVARNHMPELVQRFQVRHPEVVFSLHGGSFQDILHEVESGTADFGIVNQSRELASHLENIPLFGARLLIVSPKGNPFGLPQECSLEDLSRVPFIAFPPHYAMNKLLGEVLHARNISLRTVLEAYSYEVILQHVRCGLGITILDAFAVTRKEEFDCLNLAEELPLRRYMLIRRRDRYCSPQALAFQKEVMAAPPPLGCVALAS